MSGGISVWVPVISAGAGIIGALGSQWLSHIFITKREKRASAEKLKREQYFIGTELVFMLERFAQRCVHSAHESGYNDAENGYIRVEHFLPDFGYDAITGDWRSLPPSLMYRLSQMPVLHEEARQSIAAAFDNDSPYEGDEGLLDLNRQSCRLGLRAIRLSRELRRTCDMPDDDLSAHQWSAWRTLSIVRARIIDADLRHARSHHKTMVALSQVLPVPGPEGNALPEKEKGIPT